MHANDLEHLSRCPALSELLTEFNMKASSEVFFLCFFCFLGLFFFFIYNMVKIALCFEVRM